MINREVLLRIILAHPAIVVRSFLNIRFLSFGALINLDRPKAWYSVHWNQSQRKRSTTANLSTFKIPSPDKSSVCYLIPSDFAFFTGDLVVTRPKVGTSQTIDLCMDFQWKVKQSEMVNSNCNKDRFDKNHVANRDCASLAN